LYTPKPVRTKVIADYIAGHSKRSIARKQGIDPKTVGRILTQREVLEMQAEYQQRLLNLVPAAIDVYERALLSDDERICITVATKLIEGLQVMPRGGNGQIGDLADKASSSPVDRYRRLRADFITMVLAKSEDYDLPLPEDLARLREAAEKKMAAQGIPLPEPLAQLRKGVKSDTSVQGKSMSGENNLAVSETPQVRTSRRGL